MNPIKSNAINFVRESYISSLKNMISASSKVLRTWEELDSKARKETDGGKYPFGMSFDELLAEMYEWVVDIETRFNSLTEYHPTVKVSDLKKILESLPDDTQIVVGDLDGFYNITSIILPNDDEGYLALTLNVSDTFSTIQF